MSNRIKSQQLRIYTSCDKKYDMKYDMNARTVLRNFKYHSQ